MGWLGLYDEETWNTIKSGSLIARWPSPNTTRVDALFRMAIGTGAPDPRPGQFVFRIAPYWPDPEWFVGWFDMVAISENHLQGDSGLSATGRRVTLDLVQNYDQELPLSDVNQWIDFTFTYHRDGFDDVWFNWRWLTSALGNGLIHITADHEPGPAVEYTFTTNLLSVSNPDWTALQPELAWWWEPVNECWNPSPAPDGPGYARGNGLDAYIQLDGFTDAIFNRWEVSGDFYFRSFTRAFYLVNGNVSGQIAGISSTTAYFSTISVPHGGVIPLNEWVHLSVERSWQSPVGALMKIFMNGSEIGSATRGNPVAVFNRLIGRRPTTPGQYGNFDLKNFKLQTRTPENPLIQLQMPLESNACDQSPNANNGTTFNMDLASCP